MSKIEGIDKIYCIHIASRKDREEMILKTAKAHDINITFIDAVTPTDNIVIETLNKYNEPEKITEYMKKEYACVLSHLKAIQAIIDNNDERALIIEDDCQLIENIKTMLKRVLELWDSKQYPIIHLSPFISDYEGMKDTDFQDCDCKRCINASDRLEFKTTNNQTWSATGYIVTNEGAKKVINQSDKRFRDMKYITSETLILQQDEACLCLPPLVVEACSTPSSIQPPESNAYHIRYWGQFRQKYKYY
jgi:GR25 family glycosyltransferase involved in LPS biosynthesis